MEILDAIRNLENWGNWDYKSYPISKNEAEALISAAYGVPLSRIYIKILDMG